MAPAGTIAGALTPTHWSPDGRHIAYMIATGGFGFDLAAFAVTGDRKSFPLAKTEFFEGHASFSPDGRWVAFQTNESGNTQIYVQSFPASEGKLMVSKDGGYHPAWRSDGKELFFLSLDGRMMSATIDTAGELRAGVPTPLFPISTFSNPLLITRQYAVAKDGKRFLVNTVPQVSRTTPLTVVVNWLAAVQK